jgi:hypothetical protein
MLLKMGIVIILSFTHVLLKSQIKIVIDTKIAKEYLLQ